MDKCALLYNNSTETCETCEICTDILNNNVVQLVCPNKHKFHYDCIVMSYKISKNRECPYCRQYGGWIPLPEGTMPIQHVHKEWKNGIVSLNRCQAILKSGDLAGTKCLNAIYVSNRVYCGKHKNWDKKKENKKYLNN